MPDTFLGLLIFVVFLAPGISFFLVKESRRPQRELSAFRETALVVLAGVVCNGLALLGLLIVREFEPRLTPDLAALLTAPGTEFKTHPLFIAGWTLGVVGLACVVGAILGLTRWPSIGSIRFESAWYKAFHYFPGHAIYCGCELEDGSWVGGYLSSFNTDVEDNADRELMLTRARYRGPKGGKVVQLPGVGFVIVSARRLVRLDVSYLPPEPPNRATPGG